MISFTDDLPKQENRPYEPRGAALDLFYCKDDEVLMDGPAGTGKSRGILEKLYLCANDRYPGMRALILRQTRASITDSVLVTFEEKVIPRNHPCLGKIHRENRHSYKFPNGSEIVVGGIDNWERIMSTEYDMICAFEATEIREESWSNLVTTRMRNGVMPYQQGLADCNPSAPSHWLNKRANEGKMRRLKSRHEDNPTLYNNGQWTEFGAKYIERLKKLTGVFYKRLYLGLWAAAEGLVYQNFDRDQNGLSWVYNPELPTYVWMDFGYRRPIALFVQHDIKSSPDRWVIFDEFCPENCARDVLGDRISHWRTTVNGKDVNVRIDALWGDPAGDAKDDSGISTIQYLADHHGLVVNYSTEEAKRSIPAGVEIVRSLVCNGQNHRTLYIDTARCPKTTECFESYAYPEKLTTDLPLKDGVSDHAMDAVRYGCVNQVGLACDLSLLQGGGNRTF